ncbi:hypothetical protein J7L13_02010 [bacterium]|nr:hypothetical protein [bacterium]
MSSKQNATKKNKVYLFEVAVDTKTKGNDIFTYRAEKPLPLFSRVEVNFRSRKLEGLLIKRTLKPPLPLQRIKPLKPLDLHLFLDPFRLRLASWSAKNYLTSLGKVIFWALPELAKRRATLTPKKGIPLKVGDGFQGEFVRAEVFSRYQLYRQLIKNTLKKDQQVLLLCPNLNHWLPQRLCQEFQGAILTPNLSRTEEFSLWQEALLAKKGLFIGSQRAIFLPLRRLKLILVEDPAHPNFKQEQDPKVFIPHLALKLAQLLKIKIIFSGLVPDPLLYLYLRQKRLKFRDRYVATKVKVVDLFKESRLIGFETEQALKQAKDAIIFHNRLGYGRLFLCQECGFSLHLQPKELPPAVCPHCRGSKIRTQSFGLNRWRYELKQLFPETEVSLLTKEENEPLAQYNVASSFGLRYEHQFSLAVLGLAEIGLSLADPMMPLKVFHFSLEALSLGKKKIVQTFIPSHPLIKAIRQMNYEIFYRYWLPWREKWKLFPFFKEIKIELESPARQREKSKIYSQLKKLSALEAVYLLKDKEGKEYFLCTLKRKGKLPSALEKLLAKPGVKVEVNPY